MDRNDAKQRISARPLEWCALLLGLLALGVSVVFSAQWAEYNGQNLFVAWVMALAFVGFTNLIFEIGYGLFVRGRQARNKYWNAAGNELKEINKIVRLRYVGGVLCIVLSMFMETYNITATVGAQYNSLVTNRVSAPTVEITQTTDDVTTKRKLQEDAKKTAEDANAQLKADFDRLTVEYKKHLREYSDLKPSELDALPVSVGYQNDLAVYKANKQKNDDKIDAARAELVKLADDAAKAKNSGKSNQALFHGSVYTYLKGVTGVDEIYLQFALTALPSLFLGLISCLSLAFFLYRKPMEVAKK